MARTHEGIPAGTVTLVLGDVEGSVRHWEADGESMASASQRLDGLISELAARHKGTRPLEQGEGDSFVLAFAGASEAVEHALDLQLAIAKEPWPGGIELRMRMGMHTGDVRLRADRNYSGPAINRCARIRALAHGGQTLLSGATHDVVADGLPEGVFLRGLGLHRLRDLARPERVYQLCHPDMSDAFPPLRSLSQLPNNLPVQLTSFVGRTNEMKEIVRLLDTTRMLTLTGAGGCGKTRLALQAAADVPDTYPDGLWWVDLGPVFDPALVSSAIAASLSITENPGEPVLDRLAGMLRERRLLIVLDNCEHLVEACAESAAALLRSSPGLTILATSREQLGVAGETAYRVPSMPFPDVTVSPADAGGFDAVRLFCDRAAVVRPNFRLDEENAEPVLRICRQLDGIPLAIELAAARTRVLSPAQIASALSDRFRLLTGGARAAMARQRTLEASVDWSYNLLTESERLLLTRLSVFAGAFSLDAVEEICTDEEVGRYAALDLLSSLADKSLLQVEDDATESRFRLLETIRAYARGRLTNEGDAAALRERHLSYFVGMAESAEQELAGPNPLARVGRLDADLPNVRAAIDWALSSERVEDAMRIIGALQLYWLVRGRHSEMKRIILSALEAGPDVAPGLRLKTLSAGIMVSFTGDFVQTRRFVEEMEDVARATSDDAMLARALSWKGWTAFWMGIEPGFDQMADGLALARESGDALQLARSLHFLGTTLSIGGRAKEGLKYFEEAIELTRETNNWPGLCAALFFFGGSMTYLGEWERAEELLRESLAISRAVGYGMFASNALASLTELALARGRMDEARDFADESLRVSRDSGTPLAESFALMAQGEVEYALGDIGAAEALFDAGREKGLAAQLLFQVALCCLNLGRVALSSGNLAGARRSLEQGLEISSFYPHPRTGILRELAVLEMRSGNNGAAESFARRALTDSLESGERATLRRTLETTAALGFERGSALDAARILGAADGLSRSMGEVRMPEDQIFFDAQVSRVREALGSDAFEAAWNEGAAMSAEEAVAYGMRGRGERGRPAAGWESLTPAELEVVRLVAQGLTNPQIAERLFVTRNTVKVHLAHVFDKLGFSTRSEVAAEATRRGL